MRIHKSSKFDLPIPNKSIYDEQGFFEYGESSEIALLSSGTMLEEVLIASKYLKNRGIRTTTISFPQIKPISNLETLSRFSHLVCIEEHSSRGGFGSSILEELSNLSLFPKIKIIGTNDDHYGVIGSESYLRSVHELDAMSLADRIEKWLSAN